MSQKFNKPVVTFDLETTGTEIEKCRIVEIAMVKVHPLGIKDYFHTLVNPGMPIPETATAVHKITDMMVQSSPWFEELAPEIMEFIKDCDLAGFNIIKFDVPVLYFELLRAGVTLDYTKIKMFDSFNIYRQQERRDLSSAVKFYCNREHVDAHSALADVEATIDVFDAQLKMYEDLPVNPDELDIYCNNGKKRLDLSGKFAYNESGEIVFTFGQHIGKVAQLESKYLEWIANGTFNSDTRQIARKILNNEL